MIHNIWLEWRSPEARKELLAWCRARGCTMRKHKATQSDVDSGRTWGGIGIIQFSFVDPADEIRYEAALIQHMCNWHRQQ
jgi:hypothetical protein